MTRTELFTANVSINEVSKAIALLRSVASAFNLGVTGADVSLFDLSHGELLGNVGKLTTKCNGLSIWATDKDFGVRISPEYYESLNKTQQFTLDNGYGFKTIKRHNNERRYSFTNAMDLLQFLSTVSNYANKGSKAVTEMEVIAV